MDNLIEIKEKLDKLYKEYKDNKYQLNGIKSKETVDLLLAMYFNEEAMTADVIKQLLRFSADIVKMYFDALTKAADIQIGLIDEVLENFLLTDKDSNKSLFYFKKFAYAISSIMKNYQVKALDSMQLPRCVAFIARYAVKSDKNKEIFHNLVNETTGGVYMLNYSGIPHNELVSIWNTTTSIFPDLSKAKYESFILEWGKKNGFIKESSPPQNDKKASAVPDLKTKNDIEDTATDHRSSHDAITFIETLAGKISNNLKEDIVKEHRVVLSTLTELIGPIEKAVESLRGEVEGIRDTANINADLKKKMADMERQRSERDSSLLEAEKMIERLQSENNELKKRLAELDSKNTDLDQKLSEVYAINSREASLEAEKIRSELKKAFAYLYEDWLEYEFSDVNEENYESLQAIVRKVFRSLERNGIDFKGNNE